LRRLPAAKKLSQEQVVAAIAPCSADNDRGLDFNAARCSAVELNVAQSGPGIYDIRFNAL
jgi:hypothetical protein